MYLCNPLEEKYSQESVAILHLLGSDGSNDGSLTIKGRESLLLVLWLLLGYGIGLFNHINYLGILLATLTLYLDQFSTNSRPTHPIKFKIDI